ncbi:MAG: hypothetical protein ACREJG_09180, partial [Candidatus Rokuibacteriota bacterium]
RRLAALGLLAVVATAVMGQVWTNDIARVMEAERFVLLSPEGDMRAELGVQADGQAGLRITAGKSEVLLALTPPGTPRLELRDETGTLRAVLGETSLRRPDGAIERLPPSSLVLFAADGRVVWEMPRPAPWRADSDGDLGD